MPSVVIQSPGLLTTIQDSGRYGYQRFGMPVCGAMDLLSLELANILAGNSPHAACLEATIMGPEISFTDDTCVAVTGADMSPCINGKNVPMNTLLNVKAGDRLGFRGLISGCRSYIAFSGGIDVPMVMGSRSTYLRAQIGGLEGRALKPGDVLPLGKTTEKPGIKKIPDDIIPRYLSEQTIRITTGPEAHRFEMEGIRNFLTSEYTITDRSDRMGYRLSGKPVIHHEDRADIISAGIAPGTVQVPGDGQPVILMADRQTSGGYARIANVISIDLTLLAQMKPGDSLRFRQISLDQAQELVKERHMILACLAKKR